MYVFIFPSVFYLCYAVMERERLRIRRRAKRRTLQGNKKVLSYYFYSQSPSTVLSSEVRGTHTKSGKSSRFLFKEMKLSTLAALRRVFLVFHSAISSAEQGSEYMPGGCAARSSVRAELEKLSSPYQVPQQLGYVTRLRMALRQNPSQCWPLTARIQSRV